jgi:para-nitrobenzyl esterase
MPRNALIAALSTIAAGLAAVPAWAADTPAATPAPAAAPASATARHYTTAETTIGTLLDDPAAKAILVKYIPQLATSTQIDMARALTLKQIQSYAADMLTDDTLGKIDWDLSKLPAK